MMRYSYAPSQAVEPTKVASHSEQQWKELLRRNHILAKELSRLKSENKELRNQLNTMLLLKLTSVPKSSLQSTTMIESSTQTDENVQEGPKSPYSISTPLPHSPRNQPSNRDEIIDIKTDSYFIFNSSNSLSLFSTPKNNEKASAKSLGSKTEECTSSGGNQTSPIQSRVSLELASRLIDEGSIYSTPTVESRKPKGADTPLSSSKREPRSTRKPVSYVEPSLKVKVRKGFEFFKFQHKETEES